MQGYKIHYGTTPGSYNQVQDAGNTTTYTLQNLTECIRYYLVVTSYDTSGNESNYSNEVNGLPKPQISSISPSSAEQGRSLIVTITGNNYENGDTVRTNNTGITVLSTTYLSCTQLQSQFNIAESASTGLFDVDVVNPGSIYGRASQAFQVTPSIPPTVTSTSPADGATNVAITIHPTVTFSEAVDPASVNASTVLLLDKNSAIVPQASNSPSLNSANMIATITPQNNLSNSSTYRIKAVGGASGVRDLAGHPMSSDFIQNTGFTTVADTTAPIISNVASSNITSASADITWNTDEQADSMVEYKASGSSSYTKTSVDPALVTSHTVHLSGLNPSTLYYYHVVSKDASNNSSTSSPDKTFTTLADSAPVISNVTSSNITSTSADITWNTDKPADSMVEYKTSIASSYSQTVVNPEKVTSHTVHLTGLDPATLYFYHVISKDETGNSSTSTPDNTFTTSASPYSYLTIEAEEGEPTPPLQVGSNSNPPAYSDEYIYSPAGSGANITGNPSGKGTYDYNAPLAGLYTLWIRMYAVDSLHSSFWVKVNTGSSSAITASLYGSWEWVRGQSYSLSAGINHLELGQKDEQAEADRIIFTDDPDFIPLESPGSDRTSPAQVSSFQAAPGNKQNTLTWVNPADTDFKKTVIRYRDDGVYPKHPEDGFPVCVKSSNPSSSDSFTHTGLTNGVIYSYSAFTVDGDENASDESMTAGTPQAPSQPGSPRNNRRKDKKN